MRLFSAHETTHRRPAPAARCYSLTLPPWADPADGGSRGSRKSGSTRQVLRHMAHHLRRTSDD